MGLFLTVLVIISFVSPSFAAVQGVETFVDSTWSNVIYYIASLSGYDGLTNGYNDITINITAIDEYTLFVNDVEIDSTFASNWETGCNKDWESVEKYSVDLGGAEVINIGVKVINHGRGLGNGLIVDIEAGTDLIGTTSKLRESQLVKGDYYNIPVAWWTFDVQAMDKLGFSEDDWYAFKSDLFEDIAKAKIMRGAMLGEIGDLDHTFNPDVEVITGYFHSDVDIGSAEGGGVSLRHIEGENLALNKPAEKLELTDGNTLSGFLYTGNPLNDTKWIDLGRIYRIDKVTIFTGDSDPNVYLERSFRGYSVEISLDEYRWEEVGVIHEIGLPDAEGNINEGGYDNYTVDFPYEWARYVRYKVTETRIVMPHVGEVMVFGKGYILDAAYESDWIDVRGPDDNS